MQIESIPFTADPQGLPAKGYAYHIGLPNENPVTDDNKKKVFDGNGGPETSNPFYVDTYGHFINNNGESINPWIDSESYSITVLSPNGAQLLSIPNYNSDSISPDDIEGAIVDAVVNSLNDGTTGAKVLDLSAYAYIYVQSIESGWEDTVPGAIGGFYAHRDGTFGQAGSGDQNQFYDATGTGFTRDLEQKVKVDGSTIEVDTATNEISVIPTASATAGYIYGLDTSCSNGDDVSVLSGRCDLIDSATGLSSGVIVSLPAQSADIKLSISSGGNRASFSLLASTTYYLFVVSESDGSNPKLAFDTDITASNALSEWGIETGESYTLYRLISFSVTDSTPDILNFNHRADDWWLAKPFDDYSASISVTTAIIFAIDGVPSGVRVIPKSFITFRDATTNAQAFLLITNTDQDDLVPTLGVHTLEVVDSGSSGASVDSASLEQFYTDTNKQLRYRSTTTSGVSIDVTTNGWRFKR